ncbi:MAG: BON domain-containing protein [Armatimonadetes bacterium]|nr:BON domain-containing protein [Armatimonadota bacterium]
MAANLDWVLAEDVRGHIMDDVRLAGQSIEVTATDGYIEITGCVDAEEDKELAVELARGVPGVRGVEDKIEVRPHC